MAPVAVATAGDGLKEGPDVWELGRGKSVSAAHVSPKR